jgi:hypothetical protein
MIVVKLNQPYNGWPNRPSGWPRKRGMQICELGFVAIRISGYDARAILKSCVSLA